MSSADWMPRNLERRVEILFPVEQEDLKEKAIHILRVQLADTLKAHVMQADGSYEKIDKRGKKLICAQDTFCGEAIREAEEAKAKDDPAKDRVFIPEKSRITQEDE